MNSVIACPATRIEPDALAFTDAAQHREPGNILLVEDEELVRRATAEVLQSAGYRTVLAGSAAEALATCTASDSEVDLLLTDVVMPGMNGRDLAGHFIKFYPRTRILLMTGYAAHLSAHEGDQNEFPALASVCLAKPFSSRSLLEKVRQALAASSHDAPDELPAHC